MGFCAERGAMGGSEPIGGYKTKTKRHEMKRRGQVKIKMHDTNYEVRVVRGEVEMKQL